MSKGFPGEAELIVDGAPRRLRLTLGALAEIEDALGGGDFEALQARLQHPRVGDLIVILRALLAGGGAPMTLADLKASDLDFAAVAAAIGKAFASLSGGETAPGKPQGSAPEAAGSPSTNGLSSEYRR